MELYLAIYGIDLDAVDDEEGEPAADPAPPYRQVGMTELLLMELVDTGNRRRAEAAAHGSGKRPPKTKSFPRPKSVASEVKAHRDKVWADDFEAELKALARPK